MFYIPKDFTEFLYWFKERTEAFWRQNPRVEEQGEQFTEWPAGIHWIGLSEAEIDAVEARYNVRFTPDHREFLRVLHALDQPYTRIIPPELWGDSWDEGRTIVGRLCYNWLTEEDEIRQRLRNPYEDLRATWLRGVKPRAEAEQLAAFDERFAQAPALVPIYSHRYVVSEPLQAGNPVLSAYWGGDIIIYGWNLRDYLIYEFGEYLDIPFTSSFDEEDQQWYTHWVPEASQPREEGWANCYGRRIPFYEDYIQTWDGWPPRAEGQRLGLILDA